MKLQSHIELVQKELSELSSKAQSLFAFFCAERLRGCCWACHAVDNLNLDVFFDESDALFQMLLSKKKAEEAAVEQAIQQLEPNVPRGGEPLHVQAQSAMICLITSFDRLIDGSRTQLSDAVAASVDAVHNYDFFVRNRSKKLARSAFEDYPLLVREVGRQIADIAFIKEFERVGLADSQVIDYRIENLQYPIPPAV